MIPSFERVGRYDVNVYLGDIMYLIRAAPE